METAQRAAPGLAWRRLLAVASVTDLAVMLAVGLAFRDKSALAFSGLLLAGLLLLRLRGGLAGVVMLLVLTADTAVFMLPAAVSNATHREEVLDFLIPASLAAVSVTAAVAAAASVVRRRRVDLTRRDPPPGGGAGRVVAQAAVAAFIVAVGAGLVERAGSTAEVARVGDLVVEMKATAFAEETLTVEGGEVSAFVVNRDLFWHTFTIDALDVDLGVPTRGERRVTFRAPPGTYRFYCRPHEFVGMKGTLVVR